MEHQTASTSVPPFHRLLSFYSNRSPYPDTQTIRLQDSLTGNLALGLDFPVALGIALGRHLYLKNTGLFSLNIHVPSVTTRVTLLEGLAVDEKKSYTAGEMWTLAAPNGIAGRVDAVGLWVLAADAGTGVVGGGDVVGFQRGEVLERVRERRRGVGDVLPFWRGGPISARGHSWVVGRLFGVRVYEEGGEGGGKED